MYEGTQESSTSETAHGSSLIRKESKAVCCSTCDLLQMSKAIIVLLRISHSCNLVFRLADILLYT